MSRAEVTDRIRLSVQLSPDLVETRWWEIVQPPPSIAFSLRGRIGAALGPAADAGMRALSRLVDEGAEADLEADEQTAGEAAALQAFRRARRGQSIVGEGEPVDLVAGRLLAVASYVAGHAGAKLDSALLLGEHERTADGLGFKWTKASLLHRLLLDSRLRYGGAGARPAWPTGDPRGDTSTPGEMLWKAVNAGSVTAFVSALDSAVAGPDELTLLCTWAVLHLWRPF